MGVLELYSRNLEKMTQGTKNAVHTDTAEQARLDISAKAEWTSFDKSFFDVRVTHPIPKLFVEQIQTLPTDIQGE